MIAPGPTLQTDRLILRPIAAQDFGPWCAMMADPEVARFLGGPIPPAVVWRQITTMAGAWALFGYSMFSVIERDTGTWLGRLGPWRPHQWPGPEVGWGLVRAAWGKGYATEGATAAMDWVFDSLGWTEVIHTIAPENLGSAAVARRLGSVNQGPCVLPPPLSDIAVDSWCQSREDWRARRRG